MTTKHPRLNVTLPPEQLGLLAALAEKRQTSMSAVAHDLIALALELEEDAYFSQVAAVRDTPVAQWVPHKDAWK